MKAVILIDQEGNYIRGIEVVDDQLWKRTIENLIVPGAQRFGVTISGDDWAASRDLMTPPMNSTVADLINALGGSDTVPLEKK
jgi:hypothetical protein